MSLDARKIRLIMELRQSGIGDTRVLSAIERIPREKFVPASFADRAYENTALPLPHGQTISQPYIVALMSQALELGPRMKVLELGTGSGYQAAVLSKLCRRVYSVERIRSLLREAERTFTELRIYNITTLHGDGARGWPDLAPFERMIVTAAASEPPAELIDQLGVGGIMIIPLGRKGADQELIRIRRTKAGFDESTLCPVRFVPLIRDAERQHN
ncbi:MAG: protein-L-isoaspartate(D-aspartate) O-methyltransferase [Alphaproteobacteria bacterium]|nr:protein-L-isoaspartate(D-aspartate) O-methyltransferase [Alphaproteobacteria bacterium]